MTDALHYLSGKTPPSSCRCFALKVKGFYYALIMMGTLDSGGSRVKLTANMVGFINYRSRERPSLNVFAKRDWMRLYFGDWDGKPLICWCISEPAWEKENLIPIGEVAPKPNDPSESPNVGWNWLGIVEVLELVSALPTLDSRDDGWRGA